MMQRKKFPAGIPEGTVLKEITADEIYKLISDQLEFRKLHGNEEKTPFSFEFENILFEDTYVFKKRLKLFSLLFRIFEDIKFWDYASEISLEFKNCSIKSFVIENSRKEPLSVRFKKCEITDLKVLRFGGSDKLFIDDSKIFNCKFEKNLVLGDIFCKHTLFSEGFDCSNIEFIDSALFLHCEFGDNVRVPRIDFSNTVFNDNVSFKGSIFKNIVLFKKATFNNFVSFEEVTFNDYISFKKAIFNDYASC